MDREKMFKIEMAVVGSITLIMAFVAASPVWKSVSYDSANGNVVSTFINLTHGAQLYGTNLAVDTDARFTNARTPTAHATSHGSGQSDALSHNGLSNIQGGLSGDYFHVGSAQAAQGSLVGGTGFTLTTAQDSTRIDYSPTSSSCQTDTTFTSANLASGILTFNHNLSSQNVAVEMWDEKYSKIANADSQTNWSDNQVRLDLSSFVATSKLTPSTTWRIRALKGGTSTGGGGSATTDASLLTSGTLDAARLPNSGVTAGAYTSSSITVDSTGRVTAASSGILPEWQLVERYTVSGSAVTSKTFSGLDGYSARRYKTVARIIPAASMTDISILVNNDTNTAHYPVWSSYTDGVSLLFYKSASRYGHPIGGATANSGMSFGEAIFYMDSGSRVRINGSFDMANTSDSHKYLNWWTQWTDGSSDTTNITSLVFIADQTGGIGVGSYIELWKLAQ